jgi:chemotaxis signal transduction protein/LysM repeat protein
LIAPESPIEVLEAEAHLAGPRSREPLRAGIQCPKGDDGGLARAPDGHLLVFSVGPVGCAVRAVEVQQILPFPKCLTRLPAAPAEVAGLFAHSQGAAVAIDLRYKFGLPSRDDSWPGELLLSRIAKSWAALWVDRVLDVTPPSSLQWVRLPWPLMTTVFDGTVFYDGQLILTTDVRRLFRMPCAPREHEDTRRRVGYGRQAAMPSDERPENDDDRHIAAEVQRAARGDSEPERPATVPPDRGDLAGTRARAARNSGSADGPERRSARRTDRWPGTRTSARAQVFAPAARDRISAPSWPSLAARPQGVPIAETGAATAPITPGGDQERAQSLTGRPPALPIQRVPLAGPTVHQRDDGRARSGVSRPSWAWGVLAALLLLLMLMLIVGMTWELNPLRRAERASRQIVSRPSEPVVRTQRPPISGTEPAAPSPAPAAERVVAATPPIVEPRRDAARTLPGPPQAPTPAVAERGRIHVVRKGDTLWDIAARYLGDPFRYPEVAELSGISNPHWIYPGDIVHMPAN